MVEAAEVTIGLKAPCRGDLRKRKGKERKGIVKSDRLTRGNKKGVYTVA